MEQACDVLVVVAGSRTCALPVRLVVENMRPLETKPVAGAPRGVIGVAIVRGVATPVVDLAELLADASSPTVAPTRYVTVRTGDRCVALAVTSVRGITRLAVPPPLPLFADAMGRVVDGIAHADAELLFVLDAMRLLPAGMPDVGAA